MGKRVSNVAYRQEDAGISTYNNRVRIVRCVEEAAVERVLNMLTVEKHPLRGLRMTTMMHQSQQAHGLCTTLVETVRSWEKGK